MPAVNFSVFSIAFAAAALPPSLAKASLATDEEGVGTLFYRIFAFTAVPFESSPPSRMVLDTGYPEESEGLGGVTAGGAAASEDADDGLFALICNALLSNGFGSFDLTRDVR